jgi:hypothetical protein
MRGTIMAASILALLIVSVALAVQKAPKAGTYVGTSSEKSLVTFKVSTGGASVQGFKTRIGYNGKCGQGGGPGYEAAIAKIPIRKGSFAITSSFKGPVASVPSQPGRVTGKFSGNTVKGTVRVPSLKFRKICLAYTETYSASWKRK